MTAVVDIGCARIGGDYSIERLIEEFDPDVLYGFDPDPGLLSNTPADDWEQLKTKPRKFLTKDSVAISLEQKAAWIYDGEIGFFSDGLNSQIDLEGHQNWPKVPCFDLAAFIEGLRDKTIILKADVEAAEYQLLEHLIETEADKKLALAWVEFHPEKADPDRSWQRSIDERIGCELREWLW